MLTEFTLNLRASLIILLLIRDIQIQIININKRLLAHLITYTLPHKIFL